MTRTDDWLEGLREFVLTRRVAKPLRSSAESPSAEAAVRSIIGASLVAWLAELAAMRAARRAAPLVNADPAIVITTSVAGIEAAAEVLTSVGDLAALAGDRVEAVTELEYRLWCIRFPDEDFIHHVTIWNWVKTSVPPQRHVEFAAYPLGTDDVYWLHREGCAGAMGLDRRSCHLWKWNGRHAALLRAFVTERGVGPPGAATEEG